MIISRRDVLSLVSIISFLTLLVPLVGVSIIFVPADILEALSIILFGLLFASHIRQILLANIPRVYRVLYTG
jgi:xanthine/uracil permease